MNKIKKCLYCDKILLVNPTTKRINPKRKFCDEICKARHNAITRYNQLRDDPDFKAKNIKRAREWYALNKERQKQNVLRDYYKNKEIWGERNFINKHREKIRPFVNSECVFCGKKVKFFGLKKYGNRPTIYRGWSIAIKEKNAKILEEYAKNIVGVCSFKCLKLIKKNKK